MSAYGAKRQHSAGRIDLLPPEPRSGARTPPGLRPKEAAVDAHFVTVRANGSVNSRSTSNDNRRLRPDAPRTSPHRNGMLRLAAAAGRLGESGLQRLPGRAFAGLVTAACLFVFASAGGLSALNAALPVGDIAAPLRVSEVAARIDDRNGMKVLAVYGRLENASGVVQAAPPLDILIEDGSSTLRRRISVGAGTLAAGEGDGFVLRIPHRGGKVPKVSVSVVGQDASAQ